ncbi:MAG: hypothetical protein PHU27_08660 [Salinivirgaceae bacterium]|nr:hypothetical protein [Salinivirgaceae bacterium]MDD4746903.1 hypothetical protein [Salinivirgaceae bacterium]MDY0280989.1 hypothetical protein [Salinivirgaceae bacterium]
MNQKTIGTLLLVLMTAVIFAQDFEVSPVKLFFNSDPGSTQLKTITVKNHSSKTQSFLLSMGDFTLNSKGQREYGPANSNKRSISNWMTISPTFFEIPPNEEQQISISIQPPIDEYGSRWGVINVRTATEKMSFQADKTLSAGVMVSPRIVVEVFQTSKGGGALSAKIDQLREIESTDAAKRMFTALVTNNSDVIIPCKVYLIASDMKTGKETMFPPTLFESYPKNTHRVNLDIPKDMPKGIYALAAILDYGSASTLEGTQMVIEFNE